MPLCLDNFIYFAFANVNQEQSSCKGVYVVSLTLRKETRVMPTPHLRRDVVERFHPP